MKNYKLFWLREDRQGDYDMGTYPDRASAENEIPAATAELLSQCSSQEDRDEIASGDWKIIECADEVAQ